VHHITVRLHVVPEVQVAAKHSKNPGDEESYKAKDEPGWVLIFVVLLLLVPSNQRKDSRKEN